MHDVVRLDVHGHIYNHESDQHVYVDNNNDIVIDDSLAHEVVDELNIPLRRSIR